MRWGFFVIWSTPVLWSTPVQVPWSVLECILSFLLFGVSSDGRVDDWLRLMTWGFRNFDSCLSIFYTTLLPGEKEFRNLLIKIVHDA